MFASRRSAAQTAKTGWIYPVRFCFGMCESQLICDTGWLTTRVHKQTADSDNPGNGKTDDLARPEEFGHCK